MGNARIYKAPDLESPDPNQLGWIPTDALRSELVLGREGQTIVIHFTPETGVQVFRPSQLDATTALGLLTRAEYLLLVSSTGNTYVP